MSALDGLMRVQRWILDERRQRLSDLEGFVVKLNADLAALDRHLATDGRGLGEAPQRAPSDSPDHARRLKLVATIDELEREIEAARDELKETYDELESVEAVQRVRPAGRTSRKPRRSGVGLDDKDPSLYRKRKAVGEA